MGGRKRHLVSTVDAIIEMTLRVQQGKFSIEITHSFPTDTTKQKDILLGKPNNTQHRADNRQTRKFTEYSLEK